MKEHDFSDCFRVLAPEFAVRSCKRTGAETQGGGQGVGFKEGAPDDICDQGEISQDEGRGKVVTFDDKET